MFVVVSACVCQNIIIMEIGIHSDVFHVVGFWSWLEVISLLRHYKYLLEEESGHSSFMTSL